MFFTLEGEGSTVYYGFYMAVFENVEIVNPGPADAPRYRLIAFTKIGGKGWRHIDFSRIDYSKLRLKVLTKEYANRDPMCCPSKNAYVIYKLQDGGLREMTPKGGIKGDARR